MKTYTGLLALVLTAVGTFASETVPILKATLSIRGEHRVVLSQDGRSSDFLTIGQSFGGYTIKSYDSTSGEVALERGGKTSRVALAASVPTKVLTPVENRQILEFLSTMVKVSGMRHVNGVTTHLMIDGKSVRVGTRFAAIYNGQSYDLELTSANRNTYQLRFQGEEITRPIQ